MFKGQQEEQKSNEDGKTRSGAFFLPSQPKNLSQQDVTKLENPDSLGDVDGFAPDKEFFELEPRAPEGKTIAWRWNRDTPDVEEPAFVKKQELSFPKFKLTTYHTYVEPEDSNGTTDGSTMLVESGSAGSFVFTGNDNKSGLIQARFIRKIDLAARLSGDTKTYKWDMQCLDKFEAPFPLWRADGTPDEYSFDIIDTLYKFRRNSKYAGLGSIPQDTKTQGPKGNGWFSDFEGQYKSTRNDFDPVVEWYKLWFRQARQAEVSPNEESHVLARFWKPTTLEQQIQLKLLLSAPKKEDLTALTRFCEARSGDLNQEDEKTIKDLIKLPLTKKSAPTIVHIFAQELVNNGKFFKKKSPKITVAYEEPTTGTTGLIGAHPNGLYRLFASENDYKVLANAGMHLPDYPFPNDDQLKQTTSAKIVLQKDTNLLNAKNRVKGVDSGTESHVTKFRIAAAQKQQRVPSQDDAMGVSASELVKSWEGNQLGLQNSVEWLHRSAWSFGGLHIGGTDLGPPSSQRPENLLVGSKEANTSMLRHEIFIKRLATHAYRRISKEDNPPYVKVITRVTSPAQTFLWYAQTLQYKYSLENAVGPACNREVQFHPFSRKVPMRIEVELDRLMECMFYGWGLKIKKSSKKSDKDEEIEEEEDVHEDEDVDYRLKRVKKNRIVGGQTSEKPSGGKTFEELFGRK